MLYYAFRSLFESRLLFPAREKICCQISIHCCCRYDNALCGLRNVPERISRMRELRIFNASMGFQLRTENRILLPSIEITPGYI